MFLPLINADKSNLPLIFTEATDQQYPIEMAKPIRVICGKVGCGYAAPRWTFDFGLSFVLLCGLRGKRVLVVAGHCLPLRLLYPLR
jgi:hypothetical protein